MLSLSGRRKWVVKWDYFDSINYKEYVYCNLIFANQMYLNHSKIDTEEFWNYWHNLYE